MESNKLIENNSINQGKSKHQLSHAEIIDQIINDVNNILINYNLTVHKLSKPDEQWLFRNREYVTLLWQNMMMSHDKVILSHPCKKGFEFTFKLCIELDKPAGICISIYDLNDNTISITGFENFTRNILLHPLNGRMFKYILYIIYLYALALIENYNISEETLKIRVCDAINNEVLNYYLQHAGLVQLKGTMDCATTFDALDSYIATLDDRLGL